MDRQQLNDFSLAMEQEVSNQKLPAGLSFANLNCLCPRLKLASPVTRLGFGPEIQGDFFTGSAPKSVENSKIPTKKGKVNLSKRKM